MDKPEELECLICKHLRYAPGRSGFCAVKHPLWKVEEFCSDFQEIKMDKTDKFVKKIKEAVEEYEQEEKQDKQFVEGEIVQCKTTYKKYLVIYDAEQGQCRACSECSRRLSWTSAWKRGGRLVWSPLALTTENFVRVGNIMGCFV
jgi:hypothetical protein